MCSIEGAALLEQAKPDVLETWETYDDFSDVYWCYERH